MALVIDETLLIAAGALLIVGAGWVWTLRDYGRDPRRSAPRRWYQFSPDTYQPPDRWSLRALNREYRASDGTPW
jgi:hypothetical protein